MPEPLFYDPLSTVLESGNGELIAAKIADDEQWRFPESDSVSDKFKNSIIYFEDRYFYYHVGINPVALFRAAKQNIKAGRIVSGGSTISMQVIRLARKGKSRTFLEKIIEIILALRLELSFNKKEILNLYASHAPFGGNVVGLEAAAWRYFGRSSNKLSWGETATLAVLPNAPSLIYPGKNHIKLKTKRNRLLKKLYNKKVIDKETYYLSIAEPLPEEPNPIPQITPHLLDRTIKEGGKGKRIRTNIQYELQNKVNRIVENYHSVLSQNEIHNIAALVLDVENGSVLAYVGNTNCNDEGSGKNVDVITSPRSTGSILKPFLYAMMLQDGIILPQTLVYDIPTYIGGFSPKNFEQTYDGVVKANEALARSLNIPAVRMLQQYGLEKFYFNLKKLDFKYINKPASHYGLSIILGGAESTLWELCNNYMKMVQILNGSDSVFSASLYKTQSTKKTNKQLQPFNDGAIWCTFESLTALNRPTQESGWQMYQSMQKIAWKTGTSFGHRDAWAIGINPKYLVGIWVGNADGEGRPGLTGVEVAAPIMFKIFKYLTYNKWFQIPKENLTRVKICTQSGYLASDICVSTKKIWVPKKGITTEICPYHEIIHLDSTKQYRVSSKCYSVSNIQSVSWFVLPPIQEWYYQTKNPFYKKLPPYKKECKQETYKNMDVIYPKEYTKIFIPRELDGTTGKVVFEIAHRDNNVSIYWHLDNTYIGKTHEIHRMDIISSAGDHRMTVIDENGETISWNFELLER